MKKIDYSFIATGAAQPYKKGTWKHLQEAYQETLDALGKALSTDPTGLTVLFGCVDSGGGYPNYNLTAGAIYYNGEIYLVDATGAINVGAAQLVGVLDTQYYTDPTADPVKFTDNNTHNVHVIRKIKFQTGASASGITGNTKSDFPNVLPLSGASTAITPLNSYTIGANPAKYRKDSFGNVILTGIVTSPNPITSNQFATLPAGFRPKTSRFYVVKGSGTENYYITIGTGGAVQITKIAGGNVDTSQQCFLDGVSFNIND